MKEPKTVKFSYARANGSESFDDGVALVLPTGDVHLTMWGGENSTYVTISGTQNRLTHIVAVHTSCDSAVEVDDLRFQGDPYPAPLHAVAALGEAFVESSLRRLAARVALHCDARSQETIYGVLREALAPVL